MRQLKINRLKCIRNKFLTIATQATVEKKKCDSTAASQAYSLTLEKMFVIVCRLSAFMLAYVCILWQSKGSYSAQSNVTELTMARLPLRSLCTRNRWVHTRMCSSPSCAIHYNWQGRKRSWEWETLRIRMYRKIVIPAVPYDFARSHPRLAHILARVKSCWSEGFTSGTTRVLLVAFESTIVESMDWRRGGEWMTNHKRR